MDLQSTLNENNKLMSNNNSPSQRSLLHINDRRDSATGSSRTISPVAFFRDSSISSDIDLHCNIMDAQRRARAIATAPRRKRYDDEEDEDNEQKKIHYGFLKTPAVPIPSQTLTQQTQSLPQTQSGISLIPSFRIDPPAHDELDYLYDHTPHRKYSSGPLP